VDIQVVVLVRQVAVELLNKLKIMLRKMNQTVIKEIADQNKANGDS
jgi:hypothetical protein